MFKKLALLAFTLPTLALADGNSVVFPVPGNQYCDSSHESEFTISISNLSNNYAEVTVELFDALGTSISTPGANNAGIYSDFIPGSKVTISPLATINYHTGFGGSVSCNGRIFRGKVTNHSYDAQIIGTGWISGRAVNNFRSGATISINNGQPF